MEFIQDPATLESVYGPLVRAEAAGPRSRSADLSDQHLAFLARATMVVLASIDLDGVTCSPRGGTAGSVVLVHDAQTLWVPDAAGGGLHQTVHNVLADPRVGLLFMAPPQPCVLRVQGLARISVDAMALAAFPSLDPPLRSVLVVDVQSVRLSGRGPVQRAGLWAVGLPDGDDAAVAATLTDAAVEPSLP